MSRRLLPCALCALCALLAPALAADPRGDQPNAPASSPQEQLARFRVPPGFEVQLVAAEPEIQKPINMTFDAAGRLWVTGSEMYPWPARLDAQGQPIRDFDKGYAEIATTFKAGDKAPKAAEVATDTVRVLSDFGPDGRARKIEIFADGLNIPSGVQPLPRKPGAKGDTAIVYSIPNIWRLEDTDGDGRADLREVLYGPFGYVDTHGGSSSYLHWIDGWIYGTHGFKNRSEVRDRNGKVTILDSGNTYRFRPDGSALEIYTHGQTNPFGLTVDPLGNFYSADSHSKPVYMLQRGGYYEGIGKKDDGLGLAPRITDDDHGSSAIAGIAYYADDQWPAEFRGNLFNGNPVTQKINRDRLEWHGSTPQAVRMPDFLSCDDPWFRPVQVKLGPDGALYIADFSNPIIGHYEVPLTDPRRDRAHGRIWRVVWRGEKKTAPIATAPNLAQMDAPGLIARLKDPNLIVRTLATNELVERIGAAAEKPLHLVFEKKDREDKLGVQRAHALWAIHRIETAADPSAPGWALAQTASQMNAPALALRVQIFNLVNGLPWDDAQTIGLDRALEEGDPIAARAAAAASPINGGPSLSSLLAAWKRADPKDTHLIYAVRVALRDLLESPAAYDSQSDPALNAPDARNLAREDPNDAERLADISLAVKTPSSAEFLLAHLERTKLAAPRAGEYLRHAALHLPEEKFAALLALARQLGPVPLAQKLAVADGLTAAARTRRLKLPGELTTWTQRTMIEALASPDSATIDLAIGAVRETTLPEKLEPLRKIALDAETKSQRRVNALESLANLPQIRAVAAAALAERSALAVRKKAADLLGISAGEHDEDRAALAAALSDASTELAVTLAAALVKSDSGTEALFGVIGKGQAGAHLLRNNAVAPALAKRAAPLRERADALTKDLPPEDARLDAVIAERTTGYGKAKTDSAHGAQVFRQLCAACHRFRNEGGNVGPNLDGIIARGPARLIEDILDPNRNVDPLFRLTTFETTDGNILLGANVRDQGDTVLLADPTGQEATIAKAHIRKQTTSGLSLMPPMFEAALPPADLYNLLTYLLSPAPKP